MKLTRSRNSSVLELDKGLQERSEKFKKEKQQLIEQNKDLRLQLDKAEAENATMRSNRQEQENELKELRENKQLLNQWERQIHDIIQWVSEEKDARYSLYMHMHVSKGHLFCTLTWNGIHFDFLIPVFLFAVRYAPTVVYPWSAVCGVCSNEPLPISIRITNCSPLVRM